MAHPFRERAAAMQSRAFAHLGCNATFLAAPGGTTVALYAVPRIEDVVTQSDGFAARTMQTLRLIEIRTADVPARPAAGAVITLNPGEAGERIFTVLEEAIAPDGLSTVWICPVTEASP